MYARHSEENCRANPLKCELDAALERVRARKGANAISLGRLITGADHGDNDIQKVASDVRQRQKRNSVMRQIASTFFFHDVVGKKLQRQASKALDPLLPQRQVHEPV